MSRFPGARAALISTFFVVGLSCLLLAAKRRFFDGVVSGEEFAPLAIGISVNLFTGIAAFKSRHAMEGWLRNRLWVLRFWTICGALGALGFGGALSIISIYGVFASEERSVRKLVWFLVGTGLLVFASGCALAVLAFRPNEEISELFFD